MTGLTVMANYYHVLVLLAANVSWTTEQWKKVLWSDETRISIFGSDGLRYVRRRPGEDCLTKTLGTMVTLYVCASGPQLTCTW